MNINITFNQIKRMGKLNISPSTYCLLKYAEQGKADEFISWFNIDVTGNAEIFGLITITSNKLTPKGLQILKEIDLEEVKVDFKVLFTETQNSLLSTYGKKQVQGFGGTYFIASIKELEEFLNRFWKKYPECKDMVKITKILKQHVEKCGKSGKFAPAVKYFIGKTTDDGYVSQLAGAFENYEEPEKEEKIEPKDIKNLF